MSFDKNLIGKRWTIPIRDCFMTSDGICVGEMLPNGRTNVRLGNVYDASYRQTRWWQRELRLIRMDKLAQAGGRR